MTWNLIWGHAMCPPFVIQPIRPRRTIRFAVTSPLTGDSVRLRFSNMYGKHQYDLGECTISIGGVRAQVTQEGKTQLVIPRGGATYSDEVPLRVMRGDVVELSLYYLSRPAEGNAIESDAQVVKRLNVTHGSEEERHQRHWHYASASDGIFTVLTQSGSH